MSRMALPVLNVAKPKVIILDIDGTCVPISYFESVMKPFLATHVRPFLGGSFNKPVVQDIIKRLRIEYTRKIPLKLSDDHRTEIPESTGENGGEVLQAVFANFMSQVEEYEKSDTISALCWLVWLDGYRKQEIKYEVFPDLPEALMRWKSDNITVCTVSHMISLGQQLLMSCTNYGNLDQVISGYLCTRDINSGKTKKECYQKFCERLNVAEKDLIFFTDVGKEAVAAKEAGCRSILVRRPGNRPLKTDFTVNYNVISSFAQVNFVDV